MELSSTSASVESEQENPKKISDSDNISNVVGDVNVSGFYFFQFLHQ